MQIVNMSCKNISKNPVFVTTFLAFALFAGGCKYVKYAWTYGFDTFKDKPEINTSGFSADYDAPQIIGTIKTPEITESSGVVDSRCNENVLWTHNDSGDGSFIYALDKKGAKLGTFRVAGAKNVDWEDIATFKNPAGECFLYIGDIGNNDLDRDELTVYRVKEPIVTGDTNSSREKPIETEKAEAIKFSYPDSTHNAETLMVHPATGDVYIVTKEDSDPAGVYKLPANYNANSPNKPEKISDFKVPAIPYGLLTGGDVSPDGKHVVICDYFAAYEINLPANAKNFDEIWKQDITKINLGERKQGEAIAYSANGKSLYATSEKKNSPVILVNRK